MTVAELIEKLQEFEPGSDVKVRERREECVEYNDVVSVEADFGRARVDVVLYGA